MKRLASLLPGKTLRSLLTLLVAVPIALCLALTATAVVSRVSDARTAGRVADEVATAEQLQLVQSDVQNELLPALTLRIFEVPALYRIVGLTSLKPADIGLSPLVVGFLRGRTNADLAALRKEAGQASYAAGIASQVAKLRRVADTGSTLTTGFFAGLNLSTTLGTRIRTLLSDATGASGDARLRQALRDSALVRNAVGAGSNELGFLAAYKFPALGIAVSTARARSLYTDSWASVLSTSNAVVANAGPAAAASWRTATGTAQLRAYETSLRAYAESPDKPLSVQGLAALYQSNFARSQAFATLSKQQSATAVAAARAFASRSTASSLWLGGMVALAVLLSLGIVVVVRRALARPLLVLAGQAEQVSRGDLVDITQRGPREVQTVAHGLAAAVDNLRRMEAQAAAVAAGNLDDEILRQPLPGPLGATVHGSVTTIVDAIHERDAAQHDLAHQATHDALTDLPNRTQAMVSITHALHRGRRNGDLTGLLFVDLDHFKAVNDNLGHAAGDLVLQECAARMRETVRDSDIVFRLGGDEFVVLLEDISRDFPFNAFAERLIEEVSRPIEVRGRRVSVGASVGISLSQDASVDAERMLSEADAAAYSAKHAGRGGVGVYDENLRESLDQRAAMEHDIEQALEHGEFVLHYQPVVEMQTNRPVGFEALIRWNHPERGMVSPLDFIPIAEKSALINRIGRWTLHEALDELARWDASGSHSELTMAVNISGRHLASTDLLPDARAALDASGVPAHRLIVEVTETVIVDDPIALDNMHQLRAMGVAVAIDDFGTGYTSIGQLPKLPVDLLKIDRSFTGADDRGSRELVGLIVAAAHAFGLNVVAEGIEGARQADALRELAVDTGQGFYYARPDTASEAIRMGACVELPERIFHSDLEGDAAH